MCNDIQGMQFHIEKNEETKKHTISGRGIAAIFLLKRFHKVKLGYVRRT